MAGAYAAFHTYLFTPTPEIKCADHGTQHVSPHDHADNPVVFDDRIPPAFRFDEARGYVE